ncbi:unnamed protein product [Trichogramma brassicae]|uniref:Uncharacterized protein n=1 Tax=Trichogramma brassicae TaxID=86971 RepID=A0A6H5IXN1_9HYME|nr:unnamed protein product [Trichogramma brassicae]
MKPRQQSSHLLGDTSLRSCRGEIRAYSRFARPKRLIGLPGPSTFYVRPIKTTAAAPLSARHISYIIRTQQVDLRSCSRCRGDKGICANAWARATRREFTTAFPARTQSRNSSKKQTNPTARVHTIRLYPDLRKSKPTQTFITHAYTGPGTKNAAEQEDAVQPMCVCIMRSHGGLAKPPQATLHRSPFVCVFAPRDLHHAPQRIRKLMLRVQLELALNRLGGTISSRAIGTRSSRRHAFARVRCAFLRFFVSTSDDSNWRAFEPTRVYFCISALRRRYRVLKQLTKKALPLRDDVSL